jgi:hypothetical protein
MAEDTIVVHLDLPYGRQWVWFGDLNTLALARDLDADGRARALGDFQATFGRQILNAAV